MNKEEIIEKIKQSELYSLCSGSERVAMISGCEIALRLLSESPVQSKEDESYWKQRCEAAEEVMKVMDIPKNNSTTPQFELFRERYSNWQSLKQSLPTSKPENQDEDWEEECDRLEKVAKFWQEKYYSSCPPYQNPKIG